MLKKIWQTLVVVLLFIVFPLTSWMYLRKGLNYRLEALAKLEVKASLPADSEYYELGRMQVLYNMGQGGSKQFESIADLFKDRSDALHFKQLDAADQSASKDSMMSVWRLKYGPDQFNRSVFLIDTNSQILNSYMVGDENDMVLLTEHIALLLPSEPKQSLEFRPEKER